MTPIATWTSVPDPTETPCDTPPQVDQAAALRHLARITPRSVEPSPAPAPSTTRSAATRSPRPRRTLTLAVTSGKGGVGKTNLAVNLAVCLRSRGMGVTLVDLDVGLANADVLLGVRPRRNLADVLAGRQELADVAEETAGGISFIAGASGRDGLGPLRDTERTALAGALAGWDDDFVIFDCAAGIAPDVMTFAQAADVVLVVTTPEPTALTDAYATVKTLRRAGYGGSVRLLVNMVHSRGEAKATLGRFQRVCEKFMKFPIADAGFILHDERVELAVRHRVPFVVRYPKSSASICAQAVAARLLRGKVTRRRHADVSGHSDVPGRSGLLSRVADMFS